MSLPRVLALTPGDTLAADRARLLRAIRMALGAGLPGILLREPRLCDREWLELAHQIRGACDAAGGVWFGVHDRAHAAAVVGASAVHLGFRSLDPGVLRARFGRALCYGSSTHASDMEAAVGTAAWEQADYLLHGPVRIPTSKAEAARDRLPPIGFEGLRAAVERAGRPILALGGMTPADVAPALAAGAHGVAVLSGILGATDPAAATREYLARSPDA